MAFEPDQRIIRLTGVALKRRRLNDADKSAELPGIVWPTIRVVRYEQLDRGQLEVRFRLPNDLILV